MMYRTAGIFIVYFALTAAGVAAEFSASGFGDVRLILPPTTSSYLDGGLGKLRYGRGDSRPGAKLGEFVGEGTLTFGDSWALQADARISPEYGPAIDVIEGFARYAPKSENEWSWSARVGAFFP